MALKPSTIYAQSNEAILDILTAEKGEGLNQLRYLVVILIKTFGFSNIFFVSFNFPLREKVLWQNVVVFFFDFLNFFPSLFFKYS